MTLLADKSDDQFYTQVRDVTLCSFFCQDKCRSFESHLVNYTTKAEKKWVLDKGTLKNKNKFLACHYIHDLICCYTVIR